MSPNVIITGGSGFLGRQVSACLNKEHMLLGFSGKGGTVQCDLRHQVPRIPAEVQHVIHLAGRAHAVDLKKSGIEEFYQVNVQGTLNLLKGLENSRGTIQQVVYASTVAVYGLAQGENISEKEPKLGTTPYAKSKLEAEGILHKWAEKHGVKLLILRLPLIAGPNPPGNLGAMINALKRNRYLSIGEGAARRSMVMGTDVGRLCSRLKGSEDGIYNLTDGCHPSIRELEQLICNQLGRSLPRRIPRCVAKAIGSCGDFFGRYSPVNSNKIDKLLSTLTFTDSVAKRQLDWNPRSVIDNFTLD
jgi:nucleoside-diphosphate-sugar epimerase